MGNTLRFREYFQAAAAKAYPAFHVHKHNNIFKLLDQDNHQIALSHLAVDKKNDLFQIWNMEVAVDHRKGKIGRMITHAIARFADKHQFDKIHLMNVQDDGLSFWPYMGAEPEQKFYGLAAQIRKMMKNPTLPWEEKQKLSLLFKLADKSEEEAWFAMTDKHTSHIFLSPHTLYQVGEKLYKYNTLFFDLGRPVTRQRLGLPAQTCHLSGNAL